MATQRIASASIRGAAKAKNKNLGSANAALVQQERWKSTPAIGIDSSVSRGKYSIHFISCNVLMVLIDYFYDLPQKWKVSRKNHGVKHL